MADRSPQVGVIHCVGRLKFGKLPARDKGDAGKALGDCAPQHAIGPVRVLRWRRQLVRILPRATEFSRSWPLLNAKPVGTRPSRDVAFGINATIPLRYDPVAKALAALLILKLHLHGRSTGARALWGKKNQNQYEGVHGLPAGLVGPKQLPCRAHLAAPRPVAPRTRLPALSAWEDRPGHCAAADDQHRPAPLCLRTRRKRAVVRLLKGVLLHCRGTYRRRSLDRSSDRSSLLHAGTIEAREVWKAASHVKLGVRRAGPDRLSLWVNARGFQHPTTKRMRIDDEKKPTGSRCGCTTALRPTTTTRPSPESANPYLRLGWSRAAARLSNTELARPGQQLLSYLAT